MTTPTLKEAAAMALDALLMPCDRWNRVQSKKVAAAVSALHAALSAPADVPALPDPGYWSTRDDDTPLYTAGQMRAYGAACRAAQPAPVEQQAAEPMTYAQGWKDGYKHGAWADQPAHAQQPAAPVQPVAWSYDWIGSEHNPHFIVAGEVADGLRLGKPPLLGPDSARTNWTPLYASAAPAAPSVPQWQPIETAPKSGRKIIVAYTNRNVKPRTVIARWLTDEQAAETDTDGVGLEGGWYECIDNWDDHTEVAIHEGEPTHWMPLPAAPQPGAPAQGDA